MKQLYITLILINYIIPALAQTPVTPVLEYTFTSDAQGWTANNGNNNFAYNNLDGGEVVQTYTSEHNNPQLKSPTSLSLDISTLNYMVITVKNSNASNNQIQFVPNMTNTDNEGSAYDAFIGPFTIADNDEYVTLVIDLTTNTGEKFTTNNNLNERDKWLGTLNSFKIAVKPQNPKVSGTFHISHMAFHTTKPTISEFNYTGSGYDGLWNRKQNVDIDASAGSLNVTAGANKYAKLTLDENVRISGTTPHMYVTLVNNTIDDQLRVLGPNDNSNVYLNQTMNETAEQTLYFNLEAETSKNNVATDIEKTIAKDSDGHYYDIALSFRSTEQGFSGKSKGGVYNIKSINFYAQSLSLDSVNTLKEMSIYPNPVDDFIIIGNVNINDSVTIFNVMGQHVKAFTIQNENQQLDVSTLNAGIYFARVNNKQALKLIKN